MYVVSGVVEKTGVWEHTGHERIEAANEAATYCYQIYGNALISITSDQFYFMTSSGPITFSGEH